MGVSLTKTIQLWGYPHGHGNPMSCHVNLSGAGDDLRQWGLWRQHMASELSLGLGSTRLGRSGGRVIPREATMLPSLWIHSLSYRCFALWYYYIHYYPDDISCDYLLLLFFCFLLKTCCVIRRIGYIGWFCNQKNHGRIHIPQLVQGFLAPIELVCYSPVYQGLVNVPFWGSWTSPSNICWRLYSQSLGDVKH